MLQMLTNSVSANFWAAILLAAEAVTAGHVHLELRNSIEARSNLGRRDFASSDILHVSETPWYYVDVYIGNPPQKLKLRLEDRGETWIPWLSRITNLNDCTRRYPEAENGEMCKFANISGLYNPLDSSTFTNITESPQLKINYGESETRGIFGTETLQLNQLTITDLTVGLAYSFQTSPSLGVGMPEDTDAYPHDSFLQHLQAEGKISSLAYSLYLNDMHSTGDIYFGAVDETKFYGNLQRFNNLDNGLESHIPVNGAWWSFRNGSFRSLVQSNREDNEYVSTSSVSFGSTFLGLPQQAFDRLVAKFPTEQRNGLYWVDCNEDIDIGFLHFDIANVLYNISSRQLLSHRQYDGDKCSRFLAVDVTENYDDRTPFFRFGDPFLRGAYAVFDYTNRQTLIAPAVINATGSIIKEVGVNDAEISGTGSSKLPASYNKIPPIVDKEALVAPGTPFQPGSDPTQSKAIIVGGILGGIVALILVLGAVYAIRPRSQRSRDFKTWFTFIPARKKPSPDPEIAYPARHDSRYYQSGTTRITSVSHSPPQQPVAIHTNGSTSPTATNGGISPIIAHPSEQSYYVNTAFRSTRLSNVDEAVEMGPASSASASRNPQFQQQPNRYSTSKYDGNYIRINS
ncbi:hypothetical protein TWF225_010181 [Orbilia oligospora]|uniref:Uncharacterized protein n=1 Tax=Orbilia oligospora TaxID=2813651 RepID=A0A7C8TUJ2_ORBOL|nr:hypothetical protein TWF751_001424 [Orbilia oligospora]KAF3193430.1 hypothetical protein TWF225_010181 [Orbilia oligospora]KAF3240147.1 hypothetical protein TWF128_011403 [Orbilia oligospora]KAF3243380.1 hypothetical protein TWF217_011297 [Orbilia oligospora]KAF3296262.1 hypothetical protein TWF132_010868 [Orbilia oligospora]